MYLLRKMKMKYIYKHIRGNVARNILILIYFNLKTNQKENPH